MQLTDGPGELRVPSPTGTHRTITVRQLARGMKSYINKVSGKGMSFLIVRNGTPVARLIPLTDQPLQVIGNAANIPEGPSPLPMEELEGFGFNDLEKQVLVGLTESPVPDLVARNLERDWHEVSMAVVKLEIKGFCTKRMSGWLLTLLGQRAVLTLRAAETARDPGG